MRSFSAIRISSVLPAILFLTGLGPLEAADYKVFDEQCLYERLSYREKDTYHSLRCLMNDYQKKQYLSIGDRKGRDAWIEKFWILLDPTPTTKVNERRTEHNARVKLARELFPASHPPGWDDRGEVLICFGMPDERERVWAHIGEYTQRNPGELWRYNSPGMLVTFEDVYLNGEYTRTYIPKGEESWTSFYREAGFGESSRMTLHKNIYGSAVMQLLPVHIDPQYSNMMNLVNPDMIDFVLVERLRSEIFWAVTNQADDEYKLADKALSNSHHYIHRERFLHYPDFDPTMVAFFDITSFSAGPGRIKTEIDVEVPLSELDLQREDGRIKSEVDLRVLVRDIELKEVASGEETIELSVKDDPESLVPLFLKGHIVLTLDPGYYRFGIESIDRNSSRRGVFVASRRLDRMDPELALSDILFARTITDAERPDRYQKGLLTVIPHPLHMYRKSFPLTFYFEIYGLDTDEEDYTFYSVEYSIEPIEKKRTGPVLEEVTTVISSIFQASGFGSTQPQRFEIDTGELWEGRFRLKVAVKDRRTRAVVTRTAFFSIIE